MKLIGYIDGVEVKFDFYPPHAWRAVVPKKLTGTYIVQLKVIDGAGNETNFSDLFICIDFQSMDVRVLGKKYDFQDEGSEFLCINIDSSSDIKDIPDNYIYSELCSKFAYKELVMT